jgi:hypothetical protein
LNGTHQLLVCADDINLLDKNINMKYNTVPILDANNEADLKLNTVKTKYIFVSYHQTTGQGSFLKASNESFENEAKFKYLGITLTNQNCIHEEIKRRLKLENACYHAVCLPVCYLET